MKKEKPRYRVTVYTQKSTVTVEYPITCKFTVSRNLMSSTNRATIQLYNLAPSTRNEIFQDRYHSFDKRKYVHLEAGYGEENMSLIFKGWIVQAYSHKSGGQSDIITEIQAMPLDIFDCHTSHQFAAGTSFIDAHNTIVADMPNVTIGNIGALAGNFLTPTTFDGNAFDELNKLTGGNSFVDNGVLNTIMNNEVIEVPVPVITDDSALLDTPMRRDANLEIKTLFEPSLIIAQLLEVKSRIFTNYNGQFKVIGFTHDCLMSETQAGQRISTVNLNIGPFLPSSDVALTGNQTQPGFVKVQGTKREPVLSAQLSDVRGVFEYIQEYGIAPATQVTPNIRWRDVVRSSSLKYGYPTIVQLTNIYELAQKLQQFYDTYYRGYKLTVTSGWRSKGLNNTIPKAAPRSAHLDGKAIDFKIGSILPTAIRKKLTEYGWQGRKKAYIEDHFVHIDVLKGHGKDANDF